MKAPDAARWVERLAARIEAHAGALAAPLIEGVHAELGVGRSPHPYAPRRCELLACPKPAAPGSWQVDLGVDGPAELDGTTRLSLFVAPTADVLGALRSPEFAEQLAKKLDALAETQAYANLQLPRGDAPSAPSAARFAETSKQIDALLERLPVPEGWQARTSLALPLDWPPSPGPRLATYLGAIRFVGPTLFEFSSPIARVIHDTTLDAPPRLERLTEAPISAGTAGVQPLTSADLASVADLPRVEQAYAAIVRGHFNGNWEAALRQRWAFFRRHHGWWWRSLLAQHSAFSEWLEGDPI